MLLPGPTQLAKNVVALTIALLFTLVDPAIAQGNAVVRGFVKDSSGAAIIGAEVSASGLPYRSVTDEKGTFYLSGLTAGRVTLTARRLGFAPASILVNIDESALLGGVTLTLNRVPTVLTPVQVRSRPSRYTGRLAGYYERLERKSGGYFISREQIDKENSRTLSQLLLHAPGVTAFRGRAGLQGVRLRGRTCWPLVWIDGTPMPAGEVDLDSFAPQTIHGIELYLGSTTAPSRYTMPRNQSSCGTILLWSRGVDTDPINRPGPAPKDIKRLLASLVVYTAEQVDRPAALIDSSLVVRYPQALYAEGVRGSVVAEFVVDANGDIEEGTLDIVASSHPLFGDAVRQALESASFKPAYLKGVPVKQLVHQPVSFELNSSRTGS